MVNKNIIIRAKSYTKPAMSVVSTKTIKSSVGNFTPVQINKILSTSSKKPPLPLKEKTTIANNYSVTKTKE
jgi:hypothetical protein